MTGYTKITPEVILFYQPDIALAALDADESRHCTRVLRKKKGDLIHITDGKGVIYEAKISHADSDQCTFQIVNQRQVPLRPGHITIALAPTKSPDRLEWFVEKSVEIGVDKIILTLCDHSERTRQKPQRLNKVAVSAMKQSLNVRLPEIQGPVPLDDVILNTQSDEKFIAHVDDKNPDHLVHVATPGKWYVVLIGPEGDFSGRELALAREHHYRKVSLGQSRLRTETAGLAACHILNLVNTSNRKS